MVVFGLPGTPTGVSAAAEGEAVIVMWSPPDNTGGKPILDYAVTAESSTADAVAITATGDATTATFSDLVPDVPYSISVVARNEIGAGPASPGISVTVPVPVVPEPIEQPDETTRPGQSGAAETAALQAAIDEAFGEGLQVTDAPVQVSVSDGAGVIRLPIEGAADGDSIVGDLDVTIGGLTLKTTDGVGTARIEIGEALSVVGDARLDLSEAGVQVEITAPRLLFTPEPPDVAALSGGSDDVAIIGIDFGVELVRLPDDVVISVTYSKEIGELAAAAATTFRLQAEDALGSIDDPSTDVAFVVTVTKSGITNADLGSNRASLVVSRGWFEGRVGEGKVIVIVKQNDDGDLFHVEATCGLDAVVASCVGEFTGNAGGFSTFGLMALTVIEAPPIATPGPEQVLVPGPPIDEPVITRDVTVGPTPLPEPTLAADPPSPVPTPTAAPATRQEVPSPAVQAESAPTPSLVGQAPAGPSGTASGGGSNTPWLWLIIGVVAVAALLIGGRVVLSSRRA
ncbi:MAG: fibronectin type III domain-containing protein [Chloroflexi bacterium]|nr:fibronectin type III domain-containing protein [Chloroflexota bacterium]